MVMADELQARIQTIRTRFDNIRPNILPNLGAKMQAGGGVLGGNLQGRAQAILESRPIIGQAMRGTLMTGGKPSPTSAQLAIMQGGFRAIPPQAEQDVSLLAGNYRLAK